MDRRRADAGARRDSGAPARAAAALAALALVAAAPGCDGHEEPDSAAPVDSGTPLPSPDPGESSGDLRVSVLIDAHADDLGDTAEELMVEYEVRVEMANDGTPVSEAEVIIGTAAGPIVFDEAPGEPGLYRLTQLTYARVHTVDVSKAKWQLLGAVLVGPSFHAIELADPPAVNGGATVAWSPSGEADVVHFTVTSALLGVTYEDTATGYPDEGAAILPGSAFPVAGSYEIRVERVTDLSFDGPPAQPGVIAVSTFVEAVAE